MTLWIARDKDGELTAFEEKPKCAVEHGVWYPEDEQLFCQLLPIRWFREVTFENSPQQVELKLIETP